MPLVSAEAPFRGVQGGIAIAEYCRNDSSASTMNDTDKRKVVQSYSAFAVTCNTAVTHIQLSEEGHKFVLQRLQT